MTIRKGKNNCINCSNGKVLESEPVLYGNRQGVMYLIRVNLALFVQTNILLQNLTII